jgi:hypothetical protein
MPIISSSTHATILVSASHVPSAVRTPVSQLQTTTHLSHIVFVSGCENVRNISINIPMLYSIPFPLLRA